MRNLSGSLFHHPKLNISIGQGHMNHLVVCWSILSLSLIQ
jgi:hypothetical protein